MSRNRFSSVRVASIVKNTVYRPASFAASVVSMEAFIARSTDQP